MKRQYVCPESFAVELNGQIMEAVPPANSEASIPGEGNAKRHWIDEIYGEEPMPDGFGSIDNVHSGVNDGSSYWGKSEHFSRQASLWL